MGSGQPLHCPSMRARMGEHDAHLPLTTCLRNACRQAVHWPPPVQRSLSGFQCPAQFCNGGLRLCKLGLRVLSCRCSFAHVSPLRRAHVGHQHVFWSPTYRLSSTPLAHGATVVFHILIGCCSSGSQLECHSMNNPHEICCACFALFALQSGSS